MLRILPKARRHKIQIIHTWFLTIPNFAMLCNYSKLVNGLEKQNDGKQCWKHAMPWCFSYKSRAENNVSYTSLKPCAEHHLRFLYSLQLFSLTEKYDNNNVYFLSGCEGKSYDMSKTAATKWNISLHRSRVSSAPEKAPCTVGQNNQESRLKYWATHFSVRSSIHTAHSGTYLHTYIIWL